MIGNRIQYFFFLSIIFIHFLNVYYYFSISRFDTEILQFENDFNNKLIELQKTTEAEEKNRQKNTDSISNLLEKTMQLKQSINNKLEEIEGTLDNQKYKEMIKEIENSLKEKEDEINNQKSLLESFGDKMINQEEMRKKERKMFRKLFNNINEEISKLTTILKSITEIVLENKKTIPKFGSRDDQKLDAIREVKKKILPN